MKAQRLSLLVALAALQAGPAWSEPPPKPTPRPLYSIVAGVNVDAVDWAKLCPSVKPVSVTSGGKTCSVVHPASASTHHYYDGPLPCEKLASEYQVLTHPDPDRGGGWQHCKARFTGALLARTPPAEGFDVRLEDFKRLYFGGASK